MGGTTKFSTCLWVAAEAGFVGFVWWEVAEVDFMNTVGAALESEPMPLCRNWR